MERLIEHISLIITEKGNLDYSLSIRFLYSNNGIFEYFSSIVFFKGKPVTLKF